MSKSILGLLLVVLCCAFARAEQPIFMITKTEANTGETVNIEFRVDNFTNIISTQFSVNWDPTVLSFTSVKDLNTSVTGLSPSNFNVVDFIDEGKFTFTWFEAALNPISLPDGSLFFTVEFQVTGEPCDKSNVAITNDPLEIEVAEENEVPVGLQSNVGGVNVPGSGCLADITLVGNSINGACGDNACVQFTVENFSNVGAIEISLAYDPAVLQFDKIQNFAPLLAFGVGNTNLFAPGLIRIVWFNGNAENEDLSDGTVLFEVCFNVIGTGGQSSLITFGTSPNPMISDIDGNAHSVSIIPAQITAQCELEGFAFIAEDLCTQPNTEICMPISVNDFDDIVAFQFNLAWDPAVLKFDRLEGLNSIPGLNEDAFAFPPLLPEGNLTVSWIDLSLEGVTVPDLFDIFTICFDAVGPVGSSTDVNFAGEIEIQNAADSVLVFTVVNGGVEIRSNCDDECFISYTLSSTPPLCPREATGSINLTVDIGSCPGSPSYLWSYENRTTQDLINVPAGNYSVTITLGSQVVVAMGTVTDPPPISVSGTITNPVPPNPNSGSIVLNVTGGTAPYTYVWNTNPPATTRDLVGVPNGTYTVTVTDANGCSFVPDAFIVGADIAGSVTNVTCPGQCNGSVNVTASFGVAPYTYVWSNGNTTSTASNLCAGNFCVTITDAGGINRDTCFNITQPNQLVVTANIINDPDSNGVGAIDMNVTGGVLPYTYIWSNNATSQDLTNVGPGQYCVTITYNQTCTFDTCFLVAGSGIGISLTGDFETTCFSECNGEILTTVAGGVAPYTYSWSNGRTTPNITGLCPGTYTLTVTDATGTSSTITRVISSPPDIVINFTATDPTLGSSDGMITTNVSGGVPPYTYSWSGPVVGSGSSLFDLPAGVYTLTVRDQVGCSKTIAIPLGDGKCYKGMSIITPNDDGKNDLFVITCAQSVNNTLYIYNRYGGLVYEANNYANNWIGTDEDGDPLPDGGYHWVLQYTDVTGKQTAMGTVVILRTAD